MMDHSSPSGILLLRPARHSANIPAMPHPESDPFALDDAIPFPPPPARARGGEPLPVPADAPWLAGLNPEQLEAVTSLDGPVLVLSGAGTGKTKVLTARLAHILASRRAQPWQCLAVTFTNRAAREMKERVAGLVGPAAQDLWLGTFHSLCLRILRRHAQAVGLGADFTVLDADDQLRVLKQVMADQHIDAKATPPQALMGVIQRWKDRALTPDKVRGEHASDVAGGRGPELYRLYQDRLKGLNACDFGDLLLHTLTVFLADARVLEHWQGHFRYLLVDEYQDTNVAQYLWLRLLAQTHRNICCVGDDDQSIYSWRGAEVGNILRFDKDFPGARVVRLESNYRSTPHILGAASALIAHNQGRLGKTLRSGLSHESDSVEKVRTRAVWDGEAEARLVVEEIETIQRRGETLSSMAILVRAGFQTREFEERLITTGVPYRVIGGPRFYERLEIRDAMAYLRLVASPADGLAFERVVNTPKRGLGEAAIQSVHILARHAGVPLLEAARRLVETDELKPRARQALAGFVSDVARWRSLLDSMPHAELAATILEESGYVAMWKADKSPDAPGRVENLKELVAALEEYESLATFLEHVALVMENDAKAEQDRVAIMTLHGAKGLEFDTVFLPGWEEEVFPHARALAETGTQGLEEERRLAYVGLTRARKRALVTFAANRRIYNQWKSQLPSRFVEELPDEHVERSADRGLHGGGRQDSNAAWNESGWSDVRRSRQTARPAPAPLKTAPRQSGGGFRAGDRVFHDKFGNGSVVAVDGNKLEIAFDKAGTKKVLDSFVSAL
ncbi:ATP-dependent helicase [Magnetospirillum sp. SS-4]|uniref:ATP-dependent helicase n=1 Tax=Magnetospirillum sp. SS-4 TaxID=2681465 RepID=UPI001384D63A|nr:UvrD-helicase domain-containing protein [Magnetospirillum sp. SS-4]CAA7616144.1 putative DNA helicase II homolog [Magnetospirillum sp. SS-4]